MRLKTQILISVLGVTLLAQLVFGFLAYRQIMESRGDQLTIFLQYLNREVSEHLTVPENIAVSSIYLEELRRKFSTPNSILFVQKNDQVLYSAGNIRGDFDLIVSQLSQHFKQNGRHGLIEVGNASYYWAVSKLPNPEYKLIMLEPAGDEEIRIVSTLRSRLLSSGFIILWVAIWISLVLGSKISRRLEEQNEMLEYQALHDMLTGLPNRMLLHDRINQVLLQSERQQKFFALFLMDLNHFKEVNDTLGHQYGDDLLKMVSQRLQQAIREQDTIARLGGDEFAILMPDTDLPGAELCAQRIMKAMEAPFNVNDVTIESKVSIGISLYPDHGAAAETLMQYADVAMYQAKRSKSGYAIYSPSQNRHTVRRLKLLNDIRDAIENNVITAYYQPLINHKLHKIDGVEVLARWYHPSLGNVSPDEFIPLVEQVGLIRVLSMQILRQALKAREKWIEKGIDVNISVNVSAQCLQDVLLPEEMNSILQMYHMETDIIQVEITESALMKDLVRARKILDTLSEMGMKLAIDDFGTGFSSLAYLKKLPVDTIKIDKSFVDDLLENKGDRAIVKTIVELGHNLHCKVVAEGVEDQKTLELVNKMGVDLVQGYVFSPALTADEFVCWVEKYYTQEKVLT